MMLYKDMKAMVHSPDGGTNFFDFVTVVLQYISIISIIIYLVYVLWMSIDLMIENNITLKKTRNWWYPVKTITDAD